MMAGSADDRGCKSGQSSRKNGYTSPKAELMPQVLDFSSKVKVKEGVLTENSSGRIVTGETGLAHTRTSNGQPKFIKSIIRERCCGSGVVCGRRRRLWLWLPQITPQQGCWF